MPIFVVRVNSNSVKEYAVNCGSAEEAKMIASSLAGSQNIPLSAQPADTVVMIGNQSNTAADVAQLDVNTKWEDYTSKRIN
jgi:hypothetical protein